MACPSFVDPGLWRSVTGTSSAVPSPSSLVYYFPSGHLSDHPVGPPTTTVPFSLCRVVSVSLLADPDTDEPFSLLRLVPNPSLGPIVTSPVSSGHGVDDVISFSKVLTPSDANNGGGFSVPRFCADSIFPPLDFTADPPVQTVSIRDLRGQNWDFRHIYRGTPRRHLLTTGWSRFVAAKKLVAGDSVVFVRSKERPYELSVGIRRVGRGARVEKEAAEEAVRRMERGMEFEVVCYPRVGMAEFVVEKEVVERAVAVDWRIGMRVKMSLETGDLSRMTWFEGTVSAVAAADSPWRMLQVNIH